ncbi:hypothetical protein K432DRAFT_426315 [Lepidopterella palustris CBS 459.81]|uniref:Uncharacterized protein n=1 Tax=Lepidopterella palustris CBS 459.81 TaxID=1314670 RepID=A0A8E2E931_9PEZI|nr:hypothetical protein K432DRAFT_426315 [Lepidopterella palustris CBS 459.81]
MGQASSFNVINDDCRVPNDPDLTGPGARLSVVVPVVLVSIIAVAWTICRGRRLEHEISKIQEAAIALNGLQIAASTILLFIALSKRSTSDWFHTHFVLNTSGLSGWCTILTATVVPDYFTQYIILIPVIVAYFVVALVVLAEYHDQLQAALLAKPECYPSSLVHERFTPMIALLLIGIFVSLFVGFFNCAKLESENGGLSNLNIVRWPAKYLPLILLLPCGGIATGLYVQFWVYWWLKPLLKQSEDDWTAGQIMPLALIVISSIATLWQLFGLEGKARNQIHAAFHKMLNMTKWLWYFFCRNLDPQIFLLPLNHQFNTLPPPV